MGFTAGRAPPLARTSRCYRQGDINFILNAEPDSFAQRFARVHGPSACAMAFRVKDAASAYKRAHRLGRQAGREQGRADGAQHPGDRGHRRQPDLSRRPLRRAARIYDVDFVACRGVEHNPQGVGLTYIDHLTHNVHRGRMDQWADFYERLFNFREIRYFDIEGKLTGLQVARR